MKNVLRLSFLVALLLMLGTAAYADNVSVVTDATWNYDGYNATSSTGPFIGGGTNAVVLTGVTPVWTNPIVGSAWIANVASGPGGVHPANGYYSYTTSFTAEGLRPYTINLGSYADDTAEVFLNGSLVVNFATLGADTHCATGGGGPTCIGTPWVVTLHNFTLNPGVNTLNVIDAQTGGNSAGIDLALVAIEDKVFVPEPGSLFLLGTGLLGLAVLVFRRFRTGAPMMLNM